MHILQSIWILYVIFNQMVFLSRRDKTKTDEKDEGKCCLISILKCGHRKYDIH